MNKKRADKVTLDKYLNSTKVVGLVDCTYHNFLNSKEVALVMYYSPGDPFCTRLKPHMLKQAKSDKNPEHGYAAVNCMEEPDLCEREGMVHLPAFKLYTKGLEVNKFGDTFDYLQMDNMINKCPVMHKVHKSRVPQDPPCPRVPVVSFKTK